MATREGRDIYRLKDMSVRDNFFFLDIHTQCTPLSFIYGSGTVVSGQYNDTIYPRYRWTGLMLDMQSFVPVLRFIVTTQLYSQLPSHLLNNS
jgi:hypothetical protein